ncbi:large ribosomal subunit protein bL17m-like [Ochlerotatus camptorhynchus]|uniref:large ribosomal subunit protein bL17m-like n=1 Tax=Ochlerotatus camptorhynchus TaxID=644619 RepID=UPI0031DCCD95
MNKAEVAKLMSQLKVAIQPRHRNLKNIDGPEGRLDKLRKTVTALIKHERIELNYQRADEARGYTERLISDAIRYGNCHKPTMEMADYSLTEKQLVHKLFKVLAPRFEEYKVKKKKKKSATRMYKAPKEYPGWYRKRVVLELRGNPYPSLVQNLYQNRNLLHNVLLDEARKDFRKEKYAEIATQIGGTEIFVPARDEPRMRYT